MKTPVQYAEEAFVYGPDVRACAIAIVKAIDDLKAVEPKFEMASALERERILSRVLQEENEKLRRKLPSTARTFQRGDKFCYGNVTLELERMVQSGEKVNGEIIENPWGNYWIAQFAGSGLLCDVHAIEAHQWIAP